MVNFAHLEDCAVTNSGIKLKDKANSMSLWHKRLPIEILDWKTPFEILYNKALEYHMLKVFGCLCYATNTKPAKDKFSTRAFKCVFIGYQPGQKAYKVYDLTSKQVFTSRDVIFFENVFPFKQETDSILPLPMSTADSEHVFEESVILEPISQPEPSSPAPDLTPDLDLELTDHSTPDQISDVELAIEMLPLQPDLDFQQTRHSTRIRNKPTWMKDFVTNLSFTDPTATTNVTTIQEPKSYKEASVKAEWVQAMNKEL
ncbi:PREDICTED: uncharacterized protein LOC104589776 [Nelumbo nucifera]|uniref:Uncharacterized protein LOC104589776 n=1 Tax=Nelumbo nucifera TaxID=4432 RepID=A0A1U7Z0J8_NELNU|nr:PREDICTED: uncharacterized protein LOC104589776 [Nelumbo nucifera]